MVVFYDKGGAAVAFVDERDGESIYLFDDGTPVAWIEADAVYAYGGAFKGWIVDGWVLDTEGARVFSTDVAVGGPAKLAPAARPVRGARGVKPARGVREARPIRPVKSPAWSAQSGAQFFR
jgi:hypothetical protein